MGESTQPKKIGQYEIEGRLGRGGMGTVFRAMDAPLRQLMDHDKNP